MNTKSKFVSLLLTLAVVASGLPFTAVTASAYSDTQGGGQTPKLSR